MATTSMRVMSKTVGAYPRVRRAPTGFMSGMLRFLVAVILATSLVYGSSAIEQAIAIFKTSDLRGDNVARH